MKHPNDHCLTNDPRESRFCRTRADRFLARKSARGRSRLAFSANAFPAFFARHSAGFPDNYPRPDPPLSYLPPGPTRPRGSYSSSDLTTNRRCRCILVFLQAGRGDKKGGNSPVFARVRGTREFADRSVANHERLWTISVLLCFSAARGGRDSTSSSSSSARTDLDFRRTPRILLAGHVVCSPQQSRSGD